jgi:hypothetical protein
MPARFVQPTFERDGLRIWHNTGALAGTALRERLDFLSEDRGSHHSKEASTITVWALHFHLPNQPPLAARGLSTDKSDEQRTVELHVPLQLKSSRKSSGISGTVTSDGLQARHGIPAPPQPQAYLPVHGRSGWASQTHLVPSQTKQGFTVVISQTKFGQVELTYP